MSDDERPLWERLSGENRRAYEAFRHYRDVERRVDSVAEAFGVSQRCARGWSSKHSWRARVEAWDDECHRVEDAERLAQIRTMHANHSRAGRAAMSKALAALQALEPQMIPAGAAARLLELGARLERQTLTVSVAELQGIEVDEDEIEDPWDAIAAELAG